MRKSSVFMGLTALNIGLLVVLAAHAHRGGKAGQAASAVTSELVRHYRLTDLCLFTEARYTRNPSLADFHSPFQDHPLALEHFPSGSLVTPPPYSREAP